MVSLQIMMRILGLDIGEKRIGVAVSDALGYTAQPLEVLHRRGREDDLAAIRKIIDQTGAEALVVGLPKEMDGSIGEAAERVLSFVKEMQGVIGVPVILWDERLSTVEANRLLLEADISRRKRRRVVDKLAASLILQGYLESVGGGGEEA